MCCGDAKLRLINASHKPIARLIVVCAHASIVHGIIYMYTWHGADDVSLYHITLRHAHAPQSSTHVHLTFSSVDDDNVTRMAKVLPTVGTGAKSKATPNCEKLGSGFELNSNGSLRSKKLPRQGQLQIVRLSHILHSSRGQAASRMTTFYLPSSSSCKATSL